jgi:hypothetical protein
MSARSSRAGARLAVAVVAMVAVLVTAASAAAMPVYDNLPRISSENKKLPKNMPSIGFEATSTSQFGGLVEFSPKSKGRNNPKVTFTLSDWACQSGGGETCTSAKKSTWTWPVTVDIYEAGVGGAVGPLVASRTETVTIPFRPSASAACASEDPGGWYEPKTKECFHGLLKKYTFAFSGVTLPATEAIVAVAYNTQDHGAEPTGTPGPENSLNVGLTEVRTNGKGQKEGLPSVGGQPLPEDVFVSSSWSEMYCEGATDIGSFGDSGACWSPYQPSFEVSAEK